MTDVGVVTISEYSDVRDIISEEVVGPEDSSRWTLVETKQLRTFGLFDSPSLPRVALQTMHEDDISNGDTSLRLE